MTRSELAQLIRNEALLQGDFLLRSGQRSSEYFDKYRFESKPKILRAIASQMKELIPAQVDYLAGLEMGGIPIATALSLETELPQIFVRKKAKEYGTCQFAEGAPIQGRRLLIVEDVITTGGQVIQSAEDLRKEGAEIVGVLCVINRGEGKEIALREAGLEMKALFTKAELS